MVNLQDTPAFGPLTAADLDAARTHSTGRIYHLHRATVAQCPPCHGMCNQGRACNASDNQACAEEGGEHHEPSQTIKPRPGLGAVIVLLGWPGVAAVVGAIVAIVHNMPPIGG